MGRALQVDSDEMAVQLLLRELFRCQSARGGEIRVLSPGASAHSRRVWQELDPSWFVWTVAVSVPWRLPELSINTAEARARLLGVRWRSRQQHLHSTRYLSLLDSQVNLSHAAKGRSSSKSMSHVEKKTSGFLLASHMREINAYCRSSTNPADGASRDKLRWSTFRDRSRTPRRHRHTGSTARDGAERRGAGRPPQ